MTCDIATASWPRRWRLVGAFTLVEMVVTLGLLLIVMVLMINLAHRVRSEAAGVLTKDLLTKLDSLMAQYQRRHDRLPVIERVLPDGVVPEEALLECNAQMNNQQFVGALQAEPLWASFCAGLPHAVYDASRPALCDSWGMPIIFMPKGHSLLGTAPPDKDFFFFSAGPDKNYLTIVDNLYSYEQHGGIGGIGIRGSGVGGRVGEGSNDER